jgi:NADH-quinone oxidoreductase subunit J
MGISATIFYILSAIAIISAVMVVFSRKPVHCVLFLVITLFSIAGHYILLNAQFLAAVHIIVYAGAIMVLFLYVIMMLNLSMVAKHYKKDVFRIAVVITGCILMLVMIGTLKGLDQISTGIVEQQESGLIENLGALLYKDYLLPFEISSILFLTAMVGAVMTAKSDEKILQ